MISNMERMDFVKKLFSTLVITAVVIGCGVVGCSGPTSNPSTTKTTTTTTTTTETKKENEFKGTFDKYDKDKLTLKVDGKDKEFDVKGITPMVDGKEGKWDAIKEKADVTVMEKDSKVTKVEAKNPK
jgi:predicted small lipoprotein YifL